MDDRFPYVREILGGPLIYLTSLFVIYKMFIKRGWKEHFDPQEKPLPRKIGRSEREEVEVSAKCKLRM